jgi:hypothetical protein
MKILVTLFVLGVCGTAWAGKQKVAILGLEPVASTGKVDAASIAAAHDITDALRAHVKAGSGPFELAPGSDKELADQKLANKCADEKAPCMAIIGANLGADFLVYGKVEKVGSGYQVSLKLFDVARKSTRLIFADRVPVAAKPADIQAWAKLAYGKLTGGGTPPAKTNQHASVAP